MKKYIPIVLSLLTVAIAAASLFGNIWLRKQTPGVCVDYPTPMVGGCGIDEASWQWKTASALQEATFVVPFIGVILCAGWMIYSRIDGRKRAWAIASPFIIGGLLSIAEVFAYKPWVHYLTPAGNTYSRYGLDSLYPMATFFLVVVFIFASVIFYVSRGTAAQISWRLKQR